MSQIYGKPEAIVHASSLVHVMQGNDGVKKSMTSTPPSSDLGRATGKSHQHQTPSASHASYHHRPQGHAHAYT